MSLAKNRRQSLGGFSDDLQRPNDGILGFDVLKKLLVALSRQVDSRSPDRFQDVAEEVAVSAARHQRCFPRSGAPPRATGFHASRPESGRQLFSPATSPGTRPSP